MSQEQASLDFPEGDSKVAAKKKRKTKRKTKPKKSTEVFIPFSMGALGRSLAACRLTGFARGDDSDDLQARVAGHLVGFRDQVPSWALRMSEFEGISPVLVAVELDSSMYEDVGEYLSIGPVLPTSAIRYIGFSGPEQEQDFVARIKRFPDIPLSLFELKVVETAFGDDGNEVPIVIQESISSDKDIESRRHLSQLGGIVACLKDSLHVHNDTDEVITAALSSIDKNSGLSDVLYLASYDEARVSEIDRPVWNFAFNKLSKVSAKDGIDVFSFIDELSESFRESRDAGLEKSIENWAQFSREILEGDRDLPDSFDDSANNALRAVLLFLLTKSYSGLRDLMAQVKVGPKVRTLAFALCGLFDQVDRLPRDLKGETREELDCLSEITLDIDQGQSIQLSVSHSTWSLDFTIQDRILRGGKLFTERTFQPAADLIELFAKARRLNLEAQYDALSQCYYFSLGDQTTDAAKKSKGINLYIKVKDSSTKSRQVRFYIPLMKVTTRSPAKKKYEALLQQAWDNGIGLGLCEMYGSKQLALFSIQLIDTFDHEEFAGLMMRFQNMLAQL